MLWRNKLLKHMYKMSPKIKLLFPHLHVYTYTLFIEKYSDAFFIYIVINLKKVSIMQCQASVLTVCLIMIFRPTRDIFTLMKTSSLSLQACEFWPIRTRNSWLYGSEGFNRHPQWHGIPVYVVILQL